MIFSFSIGCRSAREFLDHWSNRYRFIERDYEKYDPFVGKPLTTEALKHLFEWKNGSEISRLKQASIARNYPLGFNKENLKERYLNANAGGGAIWNIFYMHCIDPDIWPIYDQHAHRAMHYLKTGHIDEISTKKQIIYDVYENEYLPFVLSFNEKHRKIDRALYTFGQFLKIAKIYS